MSRSPLAPPPAPDGAPPPPHGQSAVMGAQLDTRSRDLYWRAREIHDLAAIARDCATPGPHRDLCRVERTLERIAALARGGNA